MNILTQRQINILLALLFVLAPGIVAAQTPADAGNPINNPAPSYTLLEPLPCISSTDANGTPIPGSDCPTGTDGKISTKETIKFSDYIQYLFNLIIAISAVAAVLVLVWGGFKYVTTDSFGGKQEGRQVITQALQGLLLVLCSYLILRTIDPRLVAIPSTLVTPLNITKSMRTSTVDFLDQLSEQASKYTVQSQEIAADIKSTKDTLTSLDAEQKALNTKLSTMSQTDPNYEVVKKQLADTNLKITQNKDALIVQQSSLILNAQLKTSTGADGMSPSQIDASLKIVNDVRNNYTPKLLQSGGYSQINELNSQANYTEYVLQLMKNDLFATTRLAANSYNGTIVDSNNKPIPRIEDIVASVSSIEAKVSNVTNVELKARLLDKIKETKVIIAKLKK